MKKVKRDSKQISLKADEVNFFSNNILREKKIVKIKKRWPPVSFPYSLTLFISIKNKTNVIKRKIFR